MQFNPIFIPLDGILKGMKRCWKVEVEKARPRLKFIFHNFFFRDAKKDVTKIVRETNVKAIEKKKLYRQRR